MKKILLIIAGTISLGLGILGIILPGLPATSFILLSAACYARSSPRLYNWLLKNKTFGKFIEDYRNNGTMPVKHKIVSVVTMWISILISAYFLRETTWLVVVLILSGLTGTFFITLFRRRQSRSVG
jgi:uncharacterized protein